jgi:prephenate dehydratase/chorismate mutase
MDLKEIRKSIDAADYEIVKLLNKRMEYGLRLTRLKSAVTEPGREEEVISHVRSYSQNVLSPDFVENIYSTIISESKHIQQSGLQLVGFQGEHGAYSEVAAHTYGSSFVSIPCSGFHDVFKEVESGQLDFGIVPVENSIEGVVNEVNDLLVETNLHIVGEVTIPIHHSLLALPEQDYRDLRTVYSHPQALGQCRGFIARHKLEARPFYDTAGAAIMLREQKPAATAVIASKLCADLYHLEVLKENIEDNDSNRTRFVVISKGPSPDDGDKCSIIFSVSNKPGSLFSVLKVLSEGNINMTRIESRPLRNDPGIYAFFVDIEGSDKDEVIKNALNDVEKNATSYKFLGCYKEERL